MMNPQSTTIAAMKTPKTTANVDASTPATLGPASGEPGLSHAWHTLGS